MIEPFPAPQSAKADGAVGVVRTQPQSALPPLRIHHLLIWTALTAAIISGCMTFERLARNGPPIENRVIIAGMVLGAVVIAGALTVVGCGIYWRRLGFTFPQLPGDWLLMNVAIFTTVGVVAFAVFLAIFFAFGDDDWFALYFLIVGPFGWIGWMCVQYGVIMHHADTFMWRVTFGVLMLLGSPIVVVPYAFMLAVIALIVCVLATAGVDWRRGDKRSWTHWCGVACAVSLGISLLCVFRP